MGSEWIFDPANLGEKPRTFQGELLAPDAPRLRELVALPEWSLRFEVTARRDRQLRKVVSCIIEGFVFLTCQSTEEVFRHPVAIRDRLVLVDDEAQLPALQDESDREDHVVAEGELDVREMVEEAVILALPMVPRKPGLPEPKPSAAASKPGEGSPFAALQALKKRR